ncbi:hypothetical protein H9L41_11195 [Chitinimonas koreensis]|nr:hypothetical protein H9L41_11195 [Chitinimonas koreensis]
MLTVKNGNQLSVGVPDSAPVLVGGILALSGAASFNLQTGALELASGALVAPVGIGVATTLGYALGSGAGAPTFKAFATFGGRGLPAPLPLQFLPFDAATFVPQLSKVAPAYALGTFVTGVIEPLLLNPYPLAQAIFTALGLAWQDEQSKTWYLKSPLGLFEQPLRWLLNDAVVGLDGRLNIAQLAKVLALIPAAGPQDGVHVAKVDGGVRVAGLPYNVAVDFTADVDTQRFIVAPQLTAALELGIDQASIDALKFELSLDPSFQPGFTAKVTLSGQVGSSKLAIATGYDAGFLLALGSGEAQPAFVILPFPGWQTLVRQALQKAVPLLAQELTNALLEGLAQTGAADFAQRLRTAGNLLQVANLVQALANVEDPTQVPNVALTWLGGRLASSQAAETIGAVVALLTGLVAGVAQQGSLLAYQPSSRLPVTLLAGLDTSVSPGRLGLWVELTPPAIPLVKLNLGRSGFGLAFNADGTPAGGAPLFQLQASVCAPIEGSQGPALNIGFDSGTLRFTLGIDPLGGSATPSPLYRELLPKPFGLDDGGAIGEAATQWALAILVNVVPRYVSLVVLNTPAVAKWLDAQLFTASRNPTVGQILVASQLLVLEQNKYLLNSFDALRQLTVQQFLAGLLRTLLSTQIKVLTLNQTGGLWIGPQPGTEGNFGLVLQLPDLVLKSSVPTFKLQIGATDSAWIGKTGLNAEQLQPGIGVFVPIDATTPHFDRLRLLLVNVGVEFAGSDANPLVNLARFKMKSVAPRGLVTFDFGQSDIVTNYGGAISLGSIAPSLVPNVGGSNANPVAQNLLGNGSAESTDKSNPPANPTFSATAAYGHQASPSAGGLWVQLYDGQGQPSTEVVVPVQRSFGPLYVDSIGAGWQQDPKLLDILFSGSVALAGLKLDVLGLDVGVPVTNPTDFNAYQLDLKGLNVTFEGGGVDISGGLLKTTTPMLSYTGQLVVKASKFSLVALGSYAELPTANGTAPSLFAFVNLNIPLGGPPPFFVEGLAFGFGYNRDIAIPPVGQIQQFPLVQGALSSSTFGDDPTPESALEVLSQVVAPSLGRYWVAAGLRFSTFQLLDTFALLFVKFGRTFEIDLVGVTAASLPPKVPRSAAIAYMELGLVVAFKPVDGVVYAEAQLTPNSFLFAPSCRLTGGFAAYLWFNPPYSDDGPRPGDFVITLGGYNPVFSPPKWYPNPPRLGFNWPVMSTVSISGGSYFALTPSAVMAGGYLRVQFHAGPLRAWLNAGADFMIAWQPFWFSVDIYVDVGAAFETTILGISVTLSIDLGAKLHLEGPPVHGSAYVHWFVISFTIPIGDSGNNDHATLSWDDFARSFLPPQDSPEMKGSGEGSLRAAAGADADPPPPVPIKAQAQAGLLTTLDDGTWVLQSLPFALAIETAIPATASTMSAWQGATLPTGPYMGVQPCSRLRVETPFTFSLQDAAGNPLSLPVDAFAVAANIGTAPAALWGNKPFDPAAPVPAGAQLLDRTINGVTVAAVADVELNVIGPIDLARAFSFVLLPPNWLPFGSGPRYTPAAPMDQSGALARLMASVMAPGVVATREAILAALQAQGVPVVAEPDLSQIAALGWAIYQAPPTLAKLTETLAAVPGWNLPAAGPAPRLAAAAAPAPLEAPRLLGGLRRYRMPAVPAAAVPAAAVPAAAAVEPAAPRALGSDDFQIRRNALGGRRFDPLAFEPAVPLQSGGAASDMARTFAARGGPAPAPGASLGVQLHEGTVVACAVDPRGKLALSRDGVLPLKALCFGDNDALLGEVLLDEGAEHGEAPAGTATVLVQGLGLGQHAAVGWQLDAPLVRSGFDTFLADGCRLHPQAAPRYDLARRLKPRLTELTVADLALHNRVRTVGGGIEPGWLDTVLPAGMRQVAVQVEGADPADAAQAVLSIGAEIAPKPAQTRAVAGGALLIYALPDGAGATAVRTLDRAGLQVAAVLGLAEPLTRNGPASIELAAYGVRLGSRGAPASNIHIHAAPLAATEEALS